jgi:hypothetical protein
MPETGHSKLEVAGALATMIGVVVISGAMLIGSMKWCPASSIEWMEQNKLPTASVQHKG